MLNFFQIKMAFNSWNYQTMKHSWMELIIIISCCFLRIHSWLKGLSLLFQNKVMRWFPPLPPFCFTNENILSLMLHSDLCHITWQVHWRVILCLLLPASVKQKIKQMIGVITVSVCMWDLYKHCLLIVSIEILHRMFSAYSWLFFKVKKMLAFSYF